MKLKHKMRELHRAVDKRVEEGIPYLCSCRAKLTYSSGQSGQRVVFHAFPVCDAFKKQEDEKCPH